MVAFTPEEALRRYVQNDARNCRDVGASGHVFDSSTRAVLVVDCAQHYCWAQVLGDADLIEDAKLNLEHSLQLAGRITTYSTRKP